MDNVRVIDGKYQGYEGIRQREIWSISVEEGVERSAIVKLYNKANKKPFLVTIPNTSLVRN